jgi:hypothetical protein
MADKKKILSAEARQADFAPETHNDEQDDHRDQAQQVAEEAERQTPATASPLDSKRVNRGIDDSSEQDLIDRMRDMEQSGRIDMNAYRGEPNLDDDEDKYGKGHTPGD